MQGLSVHLDRKAKNHSNENIDKERSHLNYDLCEKEGDTLSRMNERLNEVYCMERKDVKACCEWVVTLPESLKNAPDEHQRKFFEETYEFLAERYGGKQNVISANVHNDEITPHIHFDFIPVVWDEKKEREKVSAKEVLTRVELKNFHNDLDNHLKERIPEIYQEGILNGKTIGLDDVESIKKYSQAIEAKKADMTKELEEFSQKEKENIAADLKKFKEPKDIFDKIDENAEKKTVGVVNKKDVVILQKKDYERLGVLAKSSIRSNYQLENYKSDAKKEIGELQKIKKELEGKNEKLEKQLERLEEHKKNEVIFKSMLQDDDRDLNISQTEIDGRLILFNLEHGYEPKNREEGEKWASVLEENKRLKTIPRSRLQRGLDKLKQFIDKLLGRGFSMDSILDKDRQEKLNKQKSKKKSHNLEL